MIIPNNPRLDVRNLGALPRGLGCPYLEVIKGLEAGVYIAKGWKRSIPAVCRSDKCGRIFIQFEAKGKRQ